MSKPDNWDEKQEALSRKAFEFRRENDFLYDVETNTTICGKCYVLLWRPAVIRATIEVMETHMGVCPVREREAIIEKNTKAYENEALFDSALAAFKSQQSEDVASDTAVIGYVVWDLSRKRFVSTVLTDREFAEDIAEPWPNPTAICPIYLPEE